jgi:site-specific DNA recombinase
MMERRQAVIYARVSSKEQEKEGFSIPAQLKLLHEYAVERGFCVVKEFIDVETAKTAGRSQFGEMVKFLQAYREAKDILVEKTDRLYRNFKDYVTLEDLDLVVHLVKESEVLSKDSRSHTKFIHGIKVLMAKNYIDNLSEETKKGMREKAEQGYYPSFAPLGYLNNRETKRIEIDPEVAPLIRKLFEWYATGNYSLLQVRNMARQLMETQGLALQYAKRLTKSTVEHILKNAVYHGDFLWNGKLYPGSHPPVVSCALWEQTQEAFRKTNHPKHTKREFPFIGMLTCAFCGCAITAELKKVNTFTTIVLAITGHA